MGVFLDLKAYVADIVADTEVIDQSWPSGAGYGLASVCCRWPFTGWARAHAA
jgi:hypothetical protein